MNYELAKELKDAGFTYSKASQKLEYEIEPHVIEVVIFPTLSELIEACGYGFRSLSRHTEYNLKREEIGLSKEGRVWIAKAGKKSGGFMKNGHTPEEAMAKLWLALNKK